MLFHGGWWNVASVVEDLTQPARSQWLMDTQYHARTHRNTLEGQTDHTLSLHHAAPQANVPDLLVQLLYMGTLAYAIQ